MDDNLRKTYMMTIDFQRMLLGLLFSFTSICLQIVEFILKCAGRITEDYTKRNKNLKPPKCV